MSFHNLHDKKKVHVLYLWSYYSLLLKQPFPTSLAMSYLLLRLISGLSILKKRPWLSCHAGLQFGHSEETPRFYKRTLDTSCAHLHMLSDHLFNHRSLLQQPTVCRCNLIAAQLSCTHLSFSLPHPTSEVYVHV